MNPPSTCRAPKGDHRTNSKDPVIGFCGTLAATRSDGRFDVMLGNAHVVTAHAGATGLKPAAGDGVRVEWPHDAPGGWRLAGVN